MVSRVPAADPRTAHQQPPKLDGGSGDRGALGGPAPGTGAPVDRFDRAAVQFFAGTGGASALKARKKRIDYDALGSFPHDAHRAWKSLNPAQRDKVKAAMKQKYGADFVKRFEAATQDKKLRSDLTRTYGPGVGPSEAKLRADGFKPYWQGKYNEIWVHPSGEMVQKVVDQGPTAKTKAPPVDPLITDGNETVADMKLWLDDLKMMNPNSKEFEESFTDFWSQLTQARDQIKDTLDAGGLEAGTKTALEKQLKELEAINKERKDSLPTVVDAGPGNSTVIMVDGNGLDWLYVSPTNP